MLIDAAKYGFEASIEHQRELSKPGYGLGGNDDSCDPARKTNVNWSSPA
jgi:hypothetical protein